MKGSREFRGIGTGSEYHGDAFHWGYSLTLAFISDFILPSLALEPHQLLERRKWGIDDDYDGDDDGDESAIVPPIYTRHALHTLSEIPAPFPSVGRDFSALGNYDECIETVIQTTTLHYLDTDSFVNEIVKGANYGTSD